MHTEIPRRSIVTDPAEMRPRQCDGECCLQVHCRRSGGRWRFDDRGIKTSLPTVLNSLCELVRRDSDKGCDELILFVQADVNGRDVVVNWVNAEVKNSGDDTSIHRTRRTVCRSAAEAFRGLILRQVGVVS